MPDDLADDPGHFLRLEKEGWDLPQGCELVRHSCRRMAIKQIAVNSQPGVKVRRCFGLSKRLM